MRIRRTDILEKKEKTKMKKPSTWTILSAQSQVRSYCSIIFCGLLLCVSARVSSAQAPGWSRGQQNLAITYDECVRRMPAALQAEGYAQDPNSGGNFVAGSKAVHTAVIICSPAPESRMLVQIVVASNGDGGGVERQRLQAQMERPGAVNKNNDSYTTWTWAYAPPGQQPEPHGEVRMYADGRAWWSGDGRWGKWSRSGNQIVIDWRPQNSSVDTLYLSRDGTVMTGANKDGWNIRATLQRQ